MAEVVEAMRRRGHEPCLQDGGREVGARLCTRSHRSGNLLEFAQQAQDLEAAAWRMRHQGYEKGKGLVEEE